MLKRYAIWDKRSDVLTPAGNVYTAEEWKNQYPVAKLSTITVVCSKGEINGGFFGTLGQMVLMYENMGADFSGAVTDEQKLEVIEAFEDSIPKTSGESSPEERIAAALELANIIALETVNPDDPDVD